MKSVMVGRVPGPQDSSTASSFFFFFPFHLNNRERQQSMLERICFIKIRFLALQSSTIYRAWAFYPLECEMLNCACLLTWRSLAEALI